MSLRLLCFLSCFILLTPLKSEAAVTAEVDRFTLYQGERLTLTLRSDTQVDQKPNLAPLSTDFRVLSSKKVTISSHHQGTVTTRTNWELRLRPINDGRLKIPALTLGQDQSPEIDLNVLPAAENPAPEDSGLRPIYLEVEIDKNELYVGSQAILRAKVFHLAPLPLDSQMSSITARNAIVKGLEQRQAYKEDVNGQNYFVTEYSYALFPRAEGMIEVEPFFFNSIQQNGETIDLTSSLLLVDVLPPAFSNTRNLWLPAEALYIEDNLPDVSQINAGETIRRTITLEAEGLPASSLPQLGDLTLNGATVTLENVVLEEQMTDQGVISQRMEELLITPEANTEITLAAIDIPWWNTKSSRGQNAAIPSRVIRVNAAVPVAAPAQPNEEPESSGVSQQEILIWILAIISMIATVALIYTWNRLRNANTPELNEEDLTDSIELQQHASEVAERNTYKALVLACNQNNPEIAQLRLIEWAQSFWDDRELHTVEEVCEHAKNQTVNFLVLDLEQHLYEGKAHLWQGDLLIEAIEKIRNRQLKRRQLDLNTGDNRLTYS